MTDNQKFYADIQRIIKHDRADHNGQYDGIRAASAITDCFIKNYRDLETVASSIGDYWLEKKVKAGTDFSKEPSEKNINWLLDAVDLLDGNLESSENFTKEDWEEIRDLVNAEATELPIEILSDLMMTIVNNGAL